MSARRSRLHNPGGLTMRILATVAFLLVNLISPAHAADPADVSKVIALATKQSRTTGVVEYMNNTIGGAHSVGITILDRGVHYRIEHFAHKFEKYQERLPAERQQLFVTVWEGPMLPTTKAYTFVDRGLRGQLLAYGVVMRDPDTGLIYPVRSDLTAAEEQRRYDEVIKAIVEFIDRK